MSAPTAGNATDDHTVTNTGKTVVVIANVGASTRTFEVEFAMTVDGQTITKLSRTVAAGASYLFGRYNTKKYGKTMSINVDHADLTILVLEP